MALEKPLHTRRKFVKQTLHIFVEEESAKNVLDIIIPKIIPSEVSFRIYPHQGKQDLEKAITKVIPAISMQIGARILIVRDQDNSDCKELKLKLQKLVGKRCAAPLLIRIVCRELESWFLGDLNAIQMAYPRFKPEKHKHKAKFKDVDIVQNANDVLRSLIPEFKERKYLPKLEFSRNIAPHLNLKENTSTSFRFFLQGVQKLLN